jgi:HEAT repeat protein
MKGMVKMIENKDPVVENQVYALIEKLRGADSMQRLKARQALVAIGWKAAPALIQMVKMESGYARWEAIEALVPIRYPGAAQVLVEALGDYDTGVHWAAARALIELDRDALGTLFKGLLEHGDSDRFREGAHHVLHVLKDRGRLRAAEIQVFKALESEEPGLQAPLAAAEVLNESNSTEV